MKTCRAGRSCVGSGETDLGVGGGAKLEVAVSDCRGEGRLSSIKIQEDGSGETLEVKTSLYLSLSLI